jgi:rubredoxin
MLDFTCPRCSASVSAQFYGPCHSCVIVLRSEQGLDRTATAAAEYVPKMNVTPNAVATKD